MSERDDHNFAEAIALSYAQSPSSNKSDPKAFGEAVRQVYQAVRGNSTDPVGVRYNNPLVSPGAYLTEMQRALSDANTLAANPGQLKSRSKEGDLSYGNEYMSDRIYVSAGFKTNEELSSLSRELVFARSASSSTAGKQQTKDGSQS